MYYPAIPTLGIEESPNYRNLVESQPDFRISNNELIGDEFFVLINEQIDCTIHLSGWGKVGIVSKRDSYFFASLKRNI